jgi:hypothetical protein
VLDLHVWLQLVGFSVKVGKSVLPADLDREGWVSILRLK